MDAERDQHIPLGTGDAATKAQCNPNELILTRVGPLRINMEISNKFEEGGPLYSIDVSGLFGDKTEITLYAGPKKDDRVLGRCRFNKFRTSEMQICPKGGASFSMLWVKQHDFYRWSIPKQSQPGDMVEGLEEKYFLWKASEDPVFSSGNLELQNLELCDMDKTVTYATYSGAAPGSKKGGNLRLRDNLGKDFTITIILTVCGLIEKERQKRARKGNFTTGMLAY